MYYLISFGVGTLFGVLLNAFWGRITGWVKARQ